MRPVCFSVFRVFSVKSWKQNECAARDETTNSNLKSNWQPDDRRVRCMGELVSHRFFGNNSSETEVL